MLGYLDYGIPASRNLATWGGRNGVFQDTRLCSDLSPSASRFRCFGAPINPLLSGETSKLKKGKKNEIYIYIRV